MKLRTTIALACVLAALPIAVIKRQAQEAKLLGPAKIIDGDSIEIGARRVRLSGVDAPELLQTCKAPDGELWPCGERAKEELVRIIGNEIVSCQQVDRDRYERIVAICHVGEIDVGQALVNGGMAVAYTRYSRRYVADEQAARLLKKGIWSGTFLQPEIWRMQKRGNGQ